MKSKPKPKGRGGRRANAGRKPLGAEARERVSLTFLPSTIALIDAKRGELSRALWVEAQINPAAVEQLIPRR